MEYNTVNTVRGCRKTESRHVGEGVCIDVCTVQQNITQIFSCKLHSRHAICAVVQFNTAEECPYPVLLHEHELSEHSDQVRKVGPQL